MNTVIKTCDLLINSYKYTLYYPQYYQKIVDSLSREVGNCFEIKSKFLHSSSKNSLVWFEEISNSEFNFALNMNEKKSYICSLRLSQELLLSENREDGELTSFVKEVKNIFQESNFSWIEYITWKHDLKEIEDFYPKGFLDHEKDMKNKLIHYMDSYHAPILEKLSNFSLDLSSKYELIRIHVLKFLAVVPCLDHDKSHREVKYALLEMIDNLLDDQNKIQNNTYKAAKALPAFYIFAFKLIKLIGSIIPAFILTPVIKSIIRFMAKRFIAGENVLEAKSVLQSLIKTNRDATFDQLGELVITQSEADNYKSRVLETIRGFEDIYKPGERNCAGILKAHASIKVSALAYDLKPYAYQYSYNQISSRLEEIFDLAIEKKVFINIDAEHFEYRDCIWRIYQEVLSKAKYQNWGDTGIVLQAYLKDAFEHFMEIQEFSKKRSIKMPVRLVKGAYWDAETVEAKAHSHIAPQFLNKVETDIHYRQLIFKILEEPFLDLALASHNIHDHCYAEVVREQIFPEKMIEHQCLHMTFEALSFALSKMNWATRNYVPIGDLLIGMSYLVRRIMENSSQTGFLFHSRKGNFSLLDFDPMRYLKSQKNTNTEDHLSTSNAFFSNPPVKLYQEKMNTHFMGSFDKVKSTLPLKFSISSDFQKIYSPNNQELVGEIDFYEIRDTEKIINQAQGAYINSQWRTNHSLRFSCLIKLSELMRIQRDELSSLIMIESGKSVLEAYADVDEAIDFVNFYVRQYQNIQSDQVFSKGIGLIIAPWNFPLAIACGMSVASLVCGNATILKSSEKTPLIAQYFYEIFSQTGAPDNIFQHIPGHGHSIGKSLSDDPRISFITFTGSKKVGIELFKKSFSTFTHLIDKKNYKREVIAEMGGKNAIVVTSSCEIDETLSGVIYSSFAHAGQKCSACSRVFVHVSVFKPFIERLKNALEVISVGSSEDLASFVNPLITHQDQERVMNVIKDIKNKISSNQILSNSKTEGRNIVSPFVFHTSLKQYESESLFQEEYFAPILQVIKYSSLTKLTEKLGALNNTEYALTSGIYSQSYKQINLISSKLEAGNIYVNRPNTGARVGIEPFGGFKLSGTGPKAGSPSYLKSFCLIKGDQVKTNIEDVTENFKDISSNAIESNILKRIENLDSSQKNSLIKSLSDFLINKEKIDNHIIPGQQSYNNYDLNISKAALVATSVEPSKESLLWVSAAYLMGIAQHVYVTNPASFKYFKDKFDYSGIEIKFISELTIAKKLNNDLIDRIYLEGDSEFIQKLLPQLIPIKNENMTKVFSSLNTLVFDEYDLLRIFKHERSFAINTMRHGAPLGLD